MLVSPLVHSAPRIDTLRGSIIRQQFAPSPRRLDLSRLHQSQQARLAACQTAFGGRQLP